MGYILNEDQKDLIDLIDKFMSAEVDPIAREYEAENKVPIEALKKATDMGLHMLDVPEEYGGGGVDPLTMQIAMQAISRHEPYFSMTLHVTGLMLNLVIKLGTEAQKQECAKIAADGGFIAFCLTEPSGSSAAKDMHTTAVLKDGKYILNGNKIFVTNGELSSKLVVFAVTNREKGSHGISVFLVDTNAPGVEVAKHEDKIGARMSPTNQIYFQDVELSEDCLLGTEGEGYIEAMKFLDGSRISMASVGLGGAQRAIEEAVKYANTRILSGRTEYSNQGVSFKLAELESRLEACRALIKHTIELREAGLPASSQGAMCKYLATDLFFDAAAYAVQFFGGYGLCKDYPVEKLLRDAKVTQIADGANEIQKLVIARNMMKQYCK